MELNAKLKEKHPDLYPEFERLHDALASARATLRPMEEEAAKIYKAIEEKNAEYRALREKIVAKERELNIKANSIQFAALASRMK